MQSVHANGRVGVFVFSVSGCVGASAGVRAVCGGRLCVRTVQAEGACRRGMLTGGAWAWRGVVCGCGGMLGGRSEWVIGCCGLV